MKGDCKNLRNELDELVNDRTSYRNAHPENGKMGKSCRGIFKDDRDNEGDDQDSISAIEL